MTEPKKAFCESLEWKREIVWSGRTGMTRLDEDRVAKIVLCTLGTHQHYPGFRVTILNKREGVVDQTYFRFDEHLDKSLESRTDGREGFPGSPKNLTFQVISHCGWHFHVAKPKTTRPFCEAVERHIDMFV